MKLVGGIMESTLGKRQYANKRRQRNADAGLCLNENARGTHGKATHGALCRRCRANHRGVPIGEVPEIDGATIGRPRTKLTVDAKTYRVLDATARARGVSIRQVANEVIGGGSMRSCGGTR